MRNDRNARPAPSRLALALCALLAATALPAMAADNPCKDGGGNLDPSLDTNAGIEFGTDNATCTPTSVAIGRENTVYSSDGVAFGAFNTVNDSQGIAFGIGNSLIPKRFGSRAIGLCAVNANRCQYAD